MGITYKKHPLHPNDILIKDFKGAISAEDIIASWEELRLSKAINKNVKGIINDLSICDLVMTLAEFGKLMEYLKGQEYLMNVKLAVITDRPSTIVFPMLGERETDLLIKPFCTTRSAVDWIING